MTLARGIAYGAHAGQVDKAGHPYIDHPRRVAENVLTYLGEDIEWGTQAHMAAEAVSWLHDVLEDTAVTDWALLAAGFPRELMDPLWALTHRKNEPRDNYYARILRQPLAIAVKKADVNDNWDKKRLVYLPEEDQERLVRKYTRAWEVLTSGSL